MISPARIDGERRELRTEDSFGVAIDTLRAHVVALVVAVATLTGAVWLFFAIAQSMLGSEEARDLWWRTPVNHLPLLLAAVLGVFAVLARWWDSGRRLRAVELLASIALPCTLVISVREGADLTIFGLVATLAIFARAGLVPASAGWGAFVSASIWVSWLTLAVHRFPESVPPTLSAVAWWTIWAVWGALTVAVATLITSRQARLRHDNRRLEQLGQYQLERKLGEGGMGTVYRAKHAMLRRPAALKLMSKKHVDALALARFEREAQLTSELRHPNTVSIYDFGTTPDGSFYYVMELLDGCDLQQLVGERGALPIGRAVHILQQVVAALREAHERGLVHRDIKPGNIFLCRGLPFDQVKVLDFGLVRNQLDTTDSALVTNPNTIVGTPFYMAPEQALGPGEVTAAADLYAVGCVAYFVLTGRPPFTGQAIDALFGHIHQAPPSIRELCPDIPESFARLVESLLCKQPHDRPASAAVVHEALTDVGAVLSWSEDDATEAWGRLPSEPSASPSSPPVAITLDAGRQATLHLRKPPDAR